MNPNIFKSIIFILVLGITQTSCNLPVYRQVTHTPQPQKVDFIPTLSVTITSTVDDKMILQETPTVEITPTTMIVDLSASEFVQADRFVVVFLPDEYQLDLYQEPGNNQTIIGSIENSNKEIHPTGNYLWIKDTLWVEIQISNMGVGWLDSANLSSLVSPSLFCNDIKVTNVIKEFINAINQRNGERFRELISPIHGLRIKHEWWNPEVRFDDIEDLKEIFEEPRSYEWGIQDSSGLPIHGTFTQVILPLLDDIGKNYSLLCNSLERGLAAGGTAGYIQWPEEYKNINYYSLYRPAADGNELDWRTWVIGFEYIGNQPYILILVQYHWEI